MSGAAGPVRNNHNGNLLTGLRGDGGRGMGAEPYKGEGGLASGGEYHNALEPFLGPPTKAIDFEPHMQFPHEAWFLPDAYAGRNDYIRETIVQMVINYNAFMTREILPWREQDNPNIAWDSIKFDKTLIDMEPEQGIPRYVTVEREAHTDYMVRRGLALIVNHGFAATPGGQKDFMYKVATIAGAVQETCDQAGVVAILRAKNEYRYKIVEDMKSASDAYDLFHHELWRWGIIQHTERGWYHMDAEAQHVMRCENIQPDTWIVPPRMTSFAAMGQMAETEVYRAGEATARGNLLRGEDNFATFRGKSVYEIKPYQLDVDGRVVDPLNRSRMIGDFFVIPYFDIARDGDGPQYPRAKKGRTQVYCCESDSFETFAWKDVHDQSKFESADTGTDHDFDDILRSIHTGMGATNVHNKALLMIKALALNAMRDSGKDSKRLYGYYNAVDVSDAKRKQLADALTELKMPWFRPVLQNQDTSGDVASLGGGTPSNKDSSGGAKAPLTSFTRFGPAGQHEQAAANLSKAMMQGFRIKYKLGDHTDPTSDAVAARTYAKPLVEAGHSAADAGAIVRTLIHHNLADNIDKRHAYLTPEQVERCDVSELQTGWVEGHKPMCTLEAATESAVRMAQKALARGMTAHDSAHNVLKAAGVSGVTVSPSPPGAAGESPSGPPTVVSAGVPGAAPEGAPTTTGAPTTAYPDGAKLSGANFDLLCVRPFRQYTMGTGVLCKKGNELGNTFRGWADFQLTDNIIAKTHIGHFTFWHASVVTNPKCLFLAEDIFCTNYEGGEGRGVLPWSEIANFREDPIGTMRANNASIIAFPVPVGAISPTDRRLCMSNPISLTGCLDPNYRSNTGRQDACRVHIGDYNVTGGTNVAMHELCEMWKQKYDWFARNDRHAIHSRGKGSADAFAKNNPPPMALEPNGGVNSLTPDVCCGGQVLSDIFNAIWGFSTMNHEVDYQNSGSFETSARLINTMCFHTMQKFQNPQNLRWEVTNLNTGHFGENGVYEGVKKIRCGFIDYFKNMEYQKAMAMGGLNI